MNKQRAHLENWIYVHIPVPVLYGIVTGHPILKDGTEVRTSQVLNIDAQKRTAETLNTHYTLGDSRMDNKTGEVANV